MWVCSVYPPCSAHLLLCCSFPSFRVLVSILVLLFYNSLCSSSSPALISSLHQFPQPWCPSAVLNCPWETAACSRKEEALQNLQKPPQVITLPWISHSDLPVLTCLWNTWWQLDSQGAVSSMSIIHPLLRNISAFPVMPSLHGIVFLSLIMNSLSLLVVLCTAATWMMLAF